MTKRRDKVTKSHAQLEAPAAREAYKQHLDERLDEALKETFPASDPIAVTPRNWPPAESPDLALHPGREFKKNLPCPICPQAQSAAKSIAIAAKGSARTPVASPR